MKHVELIIGTEKEIREVFHEKTNLHFEKQFQHCKNNNGFGRILWREGQSPNLKIKQQYVCITEN